MAKYKVIKRLVPFELNQEVDSDKELDSRFFEKLESEPKKKTAPKKLVKNA